MAPNVSESLLPETPHKLPEKAVSIESGHEDDEDEGCSCDQLSYGTGDAVFTCFIVAPLVVSQWRGTWGIMEQRPEMFPFVQSFFLGMLLHVSFAVLRSHLLSRSVSPGGQSASPARWLLERVLSRVYTYVFIVGNIMHWRGGWGLFDGVVAWIVPEPGDPHRPVAIAGFLVLFYFSIATLRSSRNLLASPYFLVTDGKEPTYLFTTRFRSSVSIYQQNITI